MSKRNVLRTITASALMFAGTVLSFQPTNWHLVAGLCLIIAGIAYAGTPKE